MGVGWGGGPSSIGQRLQGCLAHLAAQHGGAGQGMRPLPPLPGRAWVCVAWGSPWIPCGRRCTQWSAAPRVRMGVGWPVGCGVVWGDGSISVQRMWPHDSVRFTRGVHPATRPARPLPRPRAPPPPLPPCLQHLGAKVELGEAARLLAHARLKRLPAQRGVQRQPLPQQAGQLQLPFLNRWRMRGRGSGWGRASGREAEAAGGTEAAQPAAWQLASCRAVGRWAGELCCAQLLA